MARELVLQKPIVAHGHHLLKLATSIRVLAAAHAVDAWDLLLQCTS
jgi:hypothetical protein